MLTRQQIQQNINSLEQQGAKPDEIQGWLNSLPPAQNPSPNQTGSMAFQSTKPQPSLSQQIFSPSTPAQGFVAGALKSTIGSQGISGLASAIGQAGANAGLLQNKMDVQDSLTGLSDSTNRLIQSLPSVTDPNRRQSLMNLINSNMQFLSQENEKTSQQGAWNGFSNAGDFAKQIAGQGINTSLTLSPFAGGNPNIAGQVGQALGKLPIAQSSVGQFASRAIPNAINTGLQTAAFKVGQNLQTQDTSPAEGVGKAFGYGALTQGLMDAASSIVSKALGGLGSWITGKGLDATIAKLGWSKKDLESGADIANLQKWFPEGAKPAQVIDEGTKMLGSLQGQLESEVQNAASAVKFGTYTSETPQINMNDVLSSVKRSLGQSNSKNFAILQNIKSSLGDLESNIKEIAGSSMQVDLPTAQQMKIGAGMQGAWKYGIPDKTAAADEKVYNAFYSALRDQVEKSVPQGNIAQINDAMSEIIPLVQAAVRRMPSQMRSGNLDLGDWITALSVVANPKELPLLAMRFMYKTGNIGPAEIAMGKAISNIPTKVGATGIANTTAPFIKSGMASQQ